MRHIFLSPHMDDAALSAGSLMLQLVKEKKDVFVISIFTAFGMEPVSQDSTTYLRASGVSSVSLFEKERKREDQTAMKLLGIRYAHVDLIDGGFRKNKKNSFLYPMHKKLFSGSIAPEDTGLLRDITKKIITLIYPSGILYAPLGIGNHADHILVRRAVETLPNKKYYWMDQPYGYQERKLTDFAGFKEIFRIPHDKNKEQILSCYRSQIPLLYPDGIPATQEVFFEK